MNEGSKYGDVENLYKIERLRSADLTNQTMPIQNHKKCYCDFTNAGHSNRLKIE